MQCRRRLHARLTYNQTSGAHIAPRDPRGASQMLPAERLQYSAIVDRPPLQLPGGARLIVWPIVNVEVWDIGRAMPRQVLPPPTGVTQQPDFSHWAWHEYGMRVGFWRLKDALDSLGITPTLSINARVCFDYERVARAAREAGWEFMGHSYDQRPIHAEPDQRATIQKAVQVLREYTGKQPLGWLGPGLTETLDTPDFLAEAGIRYIADWVIDDEPCEIETAHGRVIAMPYTVELNDIPMMMVQHHAAREFEDRCVDYFERVYAESKTRAKVMAIAVHPYISGVPHRIRYFERVFERLKREEGVVFWTGEQILRWYEGQRDEPPLSI
jgi:allantoinase